MQRKYPGWFLAWTFFILILHAIPGKDLPHFTFLELLKFDKLVHASLFFVWTILIIKNIEARIGVSVSLFVAIIFPMLYGAFLEMMQAKVFAERTADLYDFIADSLGAIVAAWVFKPFNHKILTKYL